MESLPDLSFVIPAMNEEATIHPLYRGIAEQCQKLGKSFEVIFIDDGSTDQTAEAIAVLSKEHPNVGLIRFRRNFGKAAALDAGFKKARGQVIFTMDADLQDDPQEIPHFLKKIDEGFDCVSGWKKKRHDPIGKTLPSKFFNLTVRLTSGVKLHDFNCGFKAYAQDAAKDLQLYGEMHRFVPVLLHWRGFMVTEIAVQHHPRKHGVSKYGVERLLKGFFDLLTVLMNTRFASRPLHLFGFFGIFLATLGLSVLGYLTVGWFMGEPIGSRPLFFLGILLLMVGVQFLGTGLLGEIINRGPASRLRRYKIRSEKLPEGIDP